MKNIFFTLIICSIVWAAHSQSVSVEKSTFGIQTGYLGLYGYNESRLSDKMVLRSELGLDSGFSKSFSSSVNFLSIPVITLEPRFYYNLNKRSSQSKRIDNNSGDFFSLKSSYHPDLFVISNENNISVVSDISFVPTWGIRRSIGQHFNYEAGIGFGYKYIFRNQDVHHLDGNLHLRIGYTF